MNDVIRGTSNKITGWTEFSSNEDEQNGYYLAVNVTEWNGAKFRLDRTTGHGTEVAFKDDGIAILFLGATEEVAKTAQSFVYIKDTEEASFSIDMTFVG